MGAVRTYGDGLARMRVTGRVAEIASAPGRSLLDLGEEIGRAAVVNRAVAGLPGGIGWVAVSADGITWPPGTAEAVVAAAPPRAGLLGPRWVDPAGRPLASSGRLAARGRTRDRQAGGIEGRGEAGWGPRRRLPGPVRWGGRARAVPVLAGVIGWLDGRCLLLRRAAWDSVDGYDTRVRWPDVDLGVRLARAGWLVIGVPGVEVVVHPEGEQGMLAQ